MRETETVTVMTTYGETEFDLVAMDGNAGCKFAFKVAKWISSGLSKGTFDANNVMGLLSVLHEIPESEFDTVRRDVLRGARARVNGEFVDVNEGFLGTAFRGHPGALMKLVFQAAKLSLGNFLNDLGVQGLNSKVETGTNPAKPVLKIPTT